MTWWSDSPSPIIKAHSRTQGARESAAASQGAPFPSGGQPPRPESHPLADEYPGLDGQELGTFLRALSARRRQVREEELALLEAARAEAEALVNQARGEAEALRTQAYEAGYAAGKAAAEADVAARVQGLLTALQEEVQSLRASREALLREAEGSLLKLAVALAEKIIRKELKLDPDATRRLLEDLLPRWEGADRIIIRCHPQEVETLRAYVEAAVTSQRRFGSVQVVPSEGIELGGCVLESGFGEMDARLETRLAQMARHLEEWQAQGDVPDGV